MKKFISIYLVLAALLFNVAIPEAARSQVAINNDAVFSKGRVEKNPIANGHFESNITGWTRYADTAGAAPLDCTGGSPASTFARTTTTPLANTGSGLWTKSAANRQGEGFAYAFSIDKSKQGQVHSINYDYEVASGTFAQGDMSVWIYDVTNATVIQPSAYVMGATTIPGPAQPLTFQTSSNSTSYRLCFHTASTSTNAYSIKIDEVKISAQSIPTGTPSTSWQSCAPVYTAFGTVVTGNSEWRRIGDTLEQRGYFVAPTLSASTARIGLCGGATMDTAKVGTSQTRILGTFARASSSLTNGPATNIGPWWIVNENSTPSSVATAYSTNTAANFFPTANSNSLGSNGESFSYEFKVPVAGWSSNTQVSDSSASRAVGLRLAATPNSTITSSTWSTVTWASPSAIAKDDVGCMVVATGICTIKVSGTYRWFANLEIARSSGTATEALASRVNRNSGANVYYGARSNWVSGGSEAQGNSASGTFEAIAGDTVKFEVFISGGGLTWNAGLTGNSFGLQLEQSPAQIQAATQISAVYTGAPTGTLNSSYNTAVYPTKQVDTHGIYNTTTGEITIPAPGVYEISAFYDMQMSSATVNQYSTIAIAKNGTVMPGAAYGPYLPASIVGTTPQVSGYQFSAVTGDKITIKSLTSTSSPSYQPGSMFSIKRLGGIN